METRGSVQVKGESGPGVGVSILVDETRIRLLAEVELIGEWDIEELGVHALNDGFLIRAEGEELVLKTEDDAAVAEALGLLASTPRMARKMAASHPPEERVYDDPRLEGSRSNLAAIAFALGGVLVLAGGVFLNVDSAAPVSAADGGRPGDEGRDLWLAFVIGGGLMAVVSYVLAIGSRIARVGAVLVLTAVIVAFGFAAQDAVLDANHLLAYGFIAGGIVVGVAVVFSGSLGDNDNR